jgi:RNA polymerase sigma factor (sigma-70 family)
MRGILHESHEGNGLLRRAKAGDRAAFDALAERLERRLRTFLRSRLRADRGARLDLDAVVRDTFVRAWESMGSFRGGDLESFARWLLSIARIAVIKAAHPLEGSELALLSDGKRGGGSRGEGRPREERSEGLEEALERLHGDRKEVLLLARIEGLSMEEIAERTGRSPKEVRKLFGQALLDLRERSRKAKRKEERQT